MATLASKRKREVHDMPQLRAAPGMSNVGTHDFETQYFHTEGDGMDNNMDFAAVLAQHNADPSGAVEDDEQHAQIVGQAHLHAHGGEGAGQSASDTAAAAMAQYHVMTVPQTTEQSFMQQQSAEAAGDRQASSSADPASAQHRTTSFGDFDISTTKEGETAQDGEASPNSAAAGGNPNGPKPAVGSDEWHKVRRDNHKEVERRRRETINEGINELAKIVPGCEKNKGSILARAVQFITQLKENETQNIEKWTLEKLLTEQAIAELSSSCDKLKAECQRAWAECEQWKKAAQRAGVMVDGDEKTDADGEDAD
ncbi:hypothetical protein LTR36_000164 [Oleoguttula mirabilis]|uniref:BHLH domain-containing protein n=1 Tax=Oleoguttula mirabilis TaxID=1507867 RepID=A0AAV9JY11_9PEZI|nr:hypothetical protein LTR36_000164 [Oleoguttula mirabilis]